MIRVIVLPGGPDRPNFRLRYRDPVTRKQHWRTAKTANRRDAEREASKWEEELNSGTKATDHKMLWSAFRTRYESEALPGLAAKTAANYKTTMNLFESLIGPYRLATISEAILSQFAAKLRDGVRSENSVKTYLNQIRAILGWACQQGLLARVPEGPKVKRVKSDESPSKGRAITDAEFEGMLGAVEPVVGSAASASWKFWLTGLWWSGLRLEESLALSWELTGGLVVDTTGKYVMLRIRRQ